MVSVGMSLVINAAGLFDRIVSVYAGAIFPAVTPTFSAVDFSITAPSSETVVAGSGIFFPRTVALVAGSTQTVTLTSTGERADSSCVVSRQEFISVASLSKPTAALLTRVASQCLCLSSLSRVRHSSVERKSLPISNHESACCTGL